MNAFRVQHLLLALAGITAYLTAEELGLVHAWTGYAVGALVAIRLLLGLARKRGFEFRRLIPSITAAPAGQSGLRHPAIGRALTLTLLLAVAGTAGTGIAMDGGGTLVGKSIRADDREGEGDRYRQEDPDDEDEDFSRFSLITPAYADEPGEEHDGDDEHGLLGEVHETLGNLLLPLALLHIAYMLLLRFELAKFVLFVPRRWA